jgi:Cu2+-exporting ATPase
VEGNSEHTIGQGIRQAAEEQGVSPVHSQDFEVLKGRGVKATVDGHTTYVGGPSLLEELGTEIPQALSQIASKADEQGQTLVYLIWDDQVTAAFALADQVRPEAAQAVKKLQQEGIQVIMLTGDSEATARSVAQNLGIDRYFAQVLPEDKDEKIKELQNNGTSQVAMVGDGINDAPALARADVGIAIGSGTDVAAESAGLILVKSNPLDVVKILQISRASHRKMVQNLVWASGYNVFALPLAAGALAAWGVLLSPAVGALIMSLSTVIVAANAQLMRRVDL